MNTLETGVGGATSPAKAQFIASAASRAYKGPSVVDYLNKSGYDSSPASRMTLAENYGVQGYNTRAGNGPLNTALLTSLRGSGAENPPGTGGVATPAGGPMTLTENGGTPAPQDTPDSAYKAYLASLTDSSEIANAKRELNTLISNDKLARERALTSGETMGFAGGEAQRVARNNALTIDAATNNLRLMTEGQERNQDVAKAKYEYLTNKEKEARTNNPAFELSPGQKRYAYDPVTKGYKEVAYLPPKPTTTKTSTKGTTVSGKLTYTSDDKAEDSAALEASKGTDGYVDPAVYARLAKAWTDSGGLIKDFLSTYPPKNYVNPANNTLPVYLRSTKPTASKIEKDVEDGNLF